MPERHRTSQFIGLGRHKMTNQPKVTAEIPERAGFVVRLQECIDKVGSIGALAKKAGMAPNTIRLYLDESEPTRPMVISIAKAADVSPEWLAFGRCNKIPAEISVSTEGGEGFTTRFRDLVNRFGGPKEFSAAHALDFATIDVLLTDGHVTVRRLAALAKHPSIPIRWLISGEPGSSDTAPATSNESGTAERNREEVLLYAFSKIFNLSIHSASQRLLRSQEFKTLNDAVEEARDLVQVRYLHPPIEAEKRPVIGTFSKSTLAARLQTNDLDHLAIVDAFETDSELLQEHDWVLVDTRADQEFPYSGLYCLEYWHRFALRRIISVPRENKFIVEGFDFADTRKKFDFETRDQFEKKRYARILGRALLLVHCRVPD